MVQSRVFRAVRLAAGLLPRVMARRDTSNASYLHPYRQTIRKRGSDCAPRTVAVVPIVLVIPIVRRNENTLRSSRDRFHNAHSAASPDVIRRFQSRRSVILVARLWKTYDALVVPKTYVRGYAKSHGRELQYVWIEPPRGEGKHKTSLARTGQQ